MVKYFVLFWSKVQEYYLLISLSPCHLILAASLFSRLKEFKRVDWLIASSQRSWHLKKDMACFGCMYIYWEVIHLNFFIKILIDFMWWTKNSLSPRVWTEFGCVFLFFCKIWQLHFNVWLVASWFRGNFFAISLSIRGDVFVKFWLSCCDLSFIYCQC